MSLSQPLTVAEWREYLRGYSAEFLDSDYLRGAEAKAREWHTVSKGWESPDVVSAAQRETRWLGCEPASEQLLAETEDRLGVRLPSSYRNFLLVSNGWSTIRYWYSPIDLIGADKIGWFPDLDPELLDAWSDPGLDFFADDLAVIRRCLLISNDDGGSGGNWLLHADSVAGNGEWKAYEWWPGEGGLLEPHDDFAAMLTMR
jgi:SMI1 / KNR4 family (SUKH-1)